MGHGMLGARAVTCMVVCAELCTTSCGGKVDPGEEVVGIPGFEPGDATADAQQPDAPDALDAQQDACVPVVVQPEIMSLDLYFMLDTSGSMTGTNINALKTGVINFCNDASAAGIGITGNHFPIPKATDPYDETCVTDAYSNLAVPWDVLPYPTFASWVNGLTADGYTPTYAALTGAVDACKARIASQPTHKCAVVFVTDGNPEGNCDPQGTETGTMNALGGVAAGSYAAGIPVFTIGFPNLPSAGQIVIDYIAQQGGSTSAFIIQSGSMGAQFTAHLKAIQASVGCEFLMPALNPAVYDIDSVEVRYTPGGGTTGSFPRVIAQADCSGDGWYYDNNTTPTKILLCPDSCTKVKADSTGSVQIYLGCPST
jgi:hypothetical protein